MSVMGVKRRPSTAVKPWEWISLPKENVCLKTEEQRKLEDSHAKVKWRTRTVKIKEYFSEGKFGMVCHTPTLWDIYKLSQERNPLLKKFKTLGILEVGIKCTIN